MENWKEIPGYEGIYQVSDFGRVKSLHKKVWRTNPKKTTKKTEYTYPEKILKQDANIRNGRMYVCLQHEGTRKKYTVHQLVAMAFLGHKPCGYDLVVDHIDGNYLNNKLDNIQVISHRENVSKCKKSNSGHTGVHKMKNGKYMAYVNINKKRKHLGSFDCPTSAMIAYQKSLRDFNL